MAVASKHSPEMDLVEINNRLDATKTVVVDVETSGLDWRRNHIAGYVLTFGPGPSDTYYLPVRHFGNKNFGNLDGPTSPWGWNGKPLPMERALIKKLNTQGRKLIFHNGAFDLKFLWRVGLDSFDCHVEDTMINAPIINEWQGRFSLEHCCKVAGVQAKLGKEMTDYIMQKFPGVTDREAMGHYWRLPGNDKMATDYAKGDGTSTWQLWEKQTLELRAQDLEEVHAVESRLIPVLARMSVHGIKINVETLDATLEKTANEVATLMDGFPSGFNVKSPDDVRKWCEQHGNTDWPVTAKLRKPSFPESWLLTHDAGKAVVAVRKLETLRNTFLLPMRERHLFNGRVHTSYNQLRGDEFGTVTGRLSSNDPNLHAVPKRDKATGKMFRAIFEPDDGMRWMSTDYKQCEPVLLGFYSRCKVLLEGYRATPPVDAHQAVANATGLDRDIGKRVNQTLITGGGKGVLVEKYGVPADRIDQIWDDYFKAMPEIKALQKRASTVMKRRGYILSLLGRRARLNDPQKSYMAMNRLLQCGNADIIKLKMVELDDYLASVGRPLHLLNNVHDSVDFCFNPDDRTHINECLRIMQDFGPNAAIPLDVPLLVDAGEGQTWSEATYG